MTTREAEASLREQETPVSPAWLDFHDRYAGYIEPMGQDIAIWGLIHREPTFLEAGKVSVDHIVPPDEEEWYVVCADVHPSYQYELDSKGEFFGKARSFDLKVERNALIAAFKTKGRSRLLLNELNDPAFAEQVQRSIKSRLEEAASDRFSQYYLSDKYLVRVDTKTGKFVYGWERA